MNRSKLHSCEGRTSRRVYSHTTTTDRNNNSESDYRQEHLLEAKSTVQKDNDLNDDETAVFQKFRIRLKTMLDGSEVPVHERAQTQMVQSRNAKSDR